MARDYQTKANVGALPDTITATRFGAGEFNSIAVELENAVSTSDQTLAPADGTGEVTNQLAMALAIYGAGGAFYHADTGAVNAYVLTPISPKESPPAYFDGFTVIFEAGTVNTTASTVNVNSLGVKDITYSDGNALVGGELAGSCGIKYNLSDDRFELLFSSGALAGLSQVYVIDASQADQGAASANANTYTVFDAATAIGTTKNATIYFSHNPVAGNQTLYTFDTSLDLTTYPNIKYKMDQGAQFDRTTGDEVFTVFSPASLDVGNRQEITSVDMIDFSSPGTVYSQWWGAVADGSTDDTNAIQYAINSLTAGGIVDGLKSNYRVDSGLTLKANLRISDFEIDFSNAGADDLFTVAGSLDSSDALTADVSVDDTKAVIADTTGYSIDDYIWLESDNQYNTVDPGTFGEIQRIISTTATDLNFYDVAIHAYATADSAKVTKINFVDDIQIVDCKFSGDKSSDQNLSVFDYCSNIAIINCVSVGFFTRHWRFDTCINVTVTRCKISHCADTGLGYGVAFNNNCQWFHVNENYFEFCRHAIDTGGTRGVNRFWTANGNDISGTYSSAISTHRQAEFWEICSNRISAGSGTAVDAFGIFVRSTNGRISGNLVDYAHVDGINVTNQVSDISGRGAYLEISNNTIYRPEGKGIYINLTTDITHKNIRVIGNSIVRCDGGQGINVHQEGSGIINGLVIANNSIIDQQTAGFVCVLVFSDDTSFIDVVSINGNCLERLDDLDYNIEIVGNATNDINYITIAGNTLLNGTYGIRANLEDNITIVANTIASMATGQTSITATTQTVANNGS